MKKLLLSALLAVLTLQVNAQVEAPKDAPQLEFALQLKVTLGQAFSIENTQHGRRTVIPITGGTFEGPGSRVRLSMAVPTISWPMPRDGRSSRPSTASRPMMAFTSTFATAVSSPIPRMPTATNLSISVAPLSLRLPPIVSTVG